MEDTITKLRELLLSQSKAGRLRSLLDNMSGTPVSTPGLFGMQHQQAYSQADPALDRYMAGKESAARGVPLEAPMFAPDDLLGSGLLKGALGGAALMGGMTKRVARHGFPFDVDVLHGSPTSGLSRLITNAPPAASRGADDEGVGVVWGTTNKFNARDYSGGATIDVQSPVNQFGGKEGSIYGVKTRVSNPYVVKDLGDTSPYSRKVHIDYARANGHDAVIFRTPGKKDYEVALFNDVDVTTK